MRVRDLLKRIDGVAPTALAESWDNVGLMTGDPDMEVSRVGIALDPLPEAVAMAADRGCRVLLSHHPLFLAPIRRLDLSRDPGRAVREAIRRDVAILAAHTNWDCAKGGVSHELARRLGLEEIEPLDPGTGLGARGRFAAPVPLSDLLNRIRSAWKLSHLDCYAPENCSILRVALCGGSGSDLWPLARDWGAGLYVTADMKYHALMDAARAGLAVAVADHGQMERASLPELARRLQAGGDLDVVLLDSEGLPSPLRL